MESPIYCRVSTTLNGERIALMLGDYFKVTFRVAHHSMARGVDRLEYYYPSLSVPCYGLIQEGRAFLRRLLLLLQFSTESLLDEMVEGIVSMVQYLFQYDVVTLLPPPLESQRRDIPLRVEIIVYDFDEELEIDDYFDMIPASDEAIKTSLKKSMVTKQGECQCSICLEELEVNAECYVMACDHSFHQECILTWLQTSHMCPLCRYSLPTIED